MMYLSFEKLLSNTMMSIITKNSTLAWLMVVASAVLFSITAQAATVQAVVGRVQIERDGRLDSAAQQQMLREGDVIVTQAGGQLVLKLDDGALLLVRERARVRLETLVTLEQAGQAGQSAQVFRVIVGGLRFVTGLIGKQQPQAIRFLTPTATVGIRGTDLDVLVREIAQVDVLAGTYVQVNSGAVVLSAGAENVELAAAQSGFAGEPIITRGPQITLRRIDQIATGLFPRGSLDEFLPR
jgi:hypothetical protein